MQDSGYCKKIIITEARFNRIYANVIKIMINVQSKKNSGYNNALSARTKSISYEIHAIMILIERIQRIRAI